MANEMMEPMNRDFWRAVSAEFVAMFLFIFVGVGSALTNLGAVASADAGPLTVSLAHGMTIFVLIHCFGHISGAHINPAVTAGLMVARQVTPLRGACYIVAQVLSSIICSGILMATMGLKGETMSGYHSLSGPDDNKYARGIITEVVLTFLLMLTVFATIDPTREKTGLGPLAIGMAVAVAHFIAVPITGCGINPARSLGPALFASAGEAKDDLWVFLFSPFIGAILAAVLYPFWFAKENFVGGLKDSFANTAKVAPKGQVED